MTAGVEFQSVAQEVLAKGPFVEGELDVEGGREAPASTFLELHP
jgi:hypothetical protein